MLSLSIVVVVVVVVVSTGTGMRDKNEIRVSRCILSQNWVALSSVQATIVWKWYVGSTGTMKCLDTNGTGTDDEPRLLTTRRLVVTTSFLENDAMHLH